MTAEHRAQVREAWPESPYYLGDEPPWGVRLRRLDTKFTGHVVRVFERFSKHGCPCCRCHLPDERNGWWVVEIEGRKMPNNRDPLEIVEPPWTLAPVEGSQNPEVGSAAS